MDQKSVVYEFANQFVKHTNQNIFLTGKAGTGKTTFLHHLKEHTSKQMAVVAPTGVAAINAGGTTIHSFFQLPFTPFIPTVEGKKDLISKLKMQHHRRKVIRELELLVIDEISMVRADVLDAMDTVLRSIRYRNNEPFGGVQMIFIGDMYQLSPVAQNDEWQILSKYYQGIYFFHSHVIQQQDPVYIEFDKIFRQSDMSFINLLNEVRNNSLTPEGLAMLQSRFNPAFVPPKDDTYIILTTHNYKADKINAEELESIKTKSRIFPAQIKGDFPEKSYPMEENLELKQGAKVMFVKNDTENPRRYYNGKIGKIISFDEDSITVKCPGDDFEIEVHPVMWENLRYTTNPSTLQVEEEMLGTFTQFPLRLAWAITIHKSQGLTFEKAVIDAGAAFASGQVYVALSRCRSLEGIVLLSTINQYSIQNDEQIVRFSAQTKSVEQLSKQLDFSKRNYHDTLLLSIFDFKPMAGAAKRWFNSTKEVESSFDKETLPFVQNINEQIAELLKIATRFQSQLNQICKSLTPDVDLLQSRLKASAAYFTEKLANLTESLKASPAATDNRQNSKDYDESLVDIFTQAEQKKHLINGIQDDFSIDKYFELKNSFVMPLFSMTSYTKSKNKQKISSRHHQLMYELFQLRNELSDSLNMPIFLIAGTKTITEMADYLPQNEKEILLINGFGKVKYDKFGEIFLDKIRSYCRTNNLSSEMNKLFSEKDFEKRSKRKEKKENKPKKETITITLEYYLDGKSIAEIADIRDLTEGTITGHISKLVGMGILRIDRFISATKRETVNKILDKGNFTGSIYDVLSEVLNQQETTIMLGWIRGGKKEGKI